MGAGGAVALVLMAGALAAQDFRATITGQVTDPKQAAIHGATVRAIQRSTGAATEARTTQEGYFTLPYLQPSVDIEASAPGFNKPRRESVSGTLHGPLSKDGEFVMLGLQGYRQRIPFPLTADTPWRLLCGCCALSGG